MKKKIKCPHCGTQTEYSEANEFRPFCSERCQLIDFGKWSEEEFRVPDRENSAPQSDVDHGNPGDFEGLNQNLLH